MTSEAYRILALDPYNGTILWSLEIPDLIRMNMPRDCGNWCADDQNLFVVVKDRCWQINAGSGRILQFHQVVRGPRLDWAYDWGYVARARDRLVGSAVKQGSSPRGPLWLRLNSLANRAEKRAVIQLTCSVSFSG